MLERFTDRARRIVVLAQSEAKRLRSDHLGTEHLLFGVIAEGQSAAAVLLSDHAFSREAVLDFIDGLDPEPVAQENDDPFTSLARHALGSAEHHADELGHQYVSPEHLLLALAQVPGRASQLLTHYPSGLEALTTALRGELSAPDPSSATQRCGRCGASIKGYGQVQELSLDVRDHDPINVYAYYCGECRSTFGLVKGPSE